MTRDDDLRAKHSGGFFAGLPSAKSSVESPVAALLDRLSSLDDRANRWHDVALAAFVVSRGGTLGAWGDLRERGHPTPERGPTAFERGAGGGEGGAREPLGRDDRAMFKRVDPNAHAGYKPPEGPEAAYEPFEGPGENARKRERGAGAAEDGRGASTFAAATEALPWTVGVSAELRAARSDVAAWAGPIVGTPPRRTRSRFPSRRFASIERRSGSFPRRSADPTSREAHAATHLSPPSPPPPPPPPPPRTSPSRGSRPEPEVSRNEK